MNSEIIYAIPGMSTDSRIFDRLNMENIHAIQWLEPHSTEHLDVYVKRMLDQIPTHIDTLLAVSFGGIIAQEMCRYRSFRKLILVSTITSPYELPFYLSIMRKIPLYKLSKGTWRIKLLPIWGKWVGITDTQEILLLQDMFSKFSDHYRFWSIRQIVNWEGNEKIPLPDLIRFHGTKDPLFPIDNVSGHQVIQGGDHFMVYRKADEIRLLIQEWLEY